MKIGYLKTNHLVNPLGFDLGIPTISYVVEETEAKHQEKAQILAAKDEAFENLVFDSGESREIQNTGYELHFEMEPETRYFWKVRVWAENGDYAQSDPAWFETPKNGEFHADWITPCLPKEVQAVLTKTFTIEKKVQRARIYMSGLGVYELYVNGKKQGEECLLPGFCDYDTWIPYQTFEPELHEGENRIEIMLGDGWYKGWFGLKKKEENYGDRLAAIAELHLFYEDGTYEEIGTDLSWKARKSQVVYSGIYPGEVYDATLNTEEEFDTELLAIDKKKLRPRLNPPITIHERLKPIEVIHTPAGETVLDMGQNMVGWLEFHTTAPKGTKLYFRFGEILQDGNFYNENLRTAKAEFTYIADGRDVTVRQHFTFYGYRYVHVVGWEKEPDPEDFRGLVIHSEMEEIGRIETSDPLVNQLVHNAKWGQKGNFLDVPTDCPQRDERCGWTGDAQIFSGTACFFMDTYAFYTKYGKDIYCEQQKLNGSVPDVVPLANWVGDASTAWGDAATIIPWNVYLHYGDKGILRRQFDSMKAWVDFMRQEDVKYGNRYLWQSGAHYADWLALDGNVEGGVYGATDPFLISSAYYYYSTNLAAKAAEVLCYEKEASYYKELAEKIKEAFIHEYFTPGGRLSVNTMTAYVLVLYMGLTPDYAYEKTCEGLLDSLKKNRYHLNTGFVGTPYLCRVLSENGMNDLAYTLLMEKGFPGWLYEVLMGATTIWERWNSVLPDGKISGTGMNSLNHYSYGSIVEWMYRNMLGINPSEEGAGFRKFRVSPAPDYQISWAKAELRSPMGTIRSEWRIEGRELHFEIQVPFDAQAVIVLPYAEESVICALMKEKEGILSVKQKGENVEVTVETGCYSFRYEPTVPCRKIYSVHSPWQELVENEKTRGILEKEYLSIVGKIPFDAELYTLKEQMNGPFGFVPYEQQDKIDQMLRAVEE